MSFDQKPRMSVVGLGKLGAPLAAVLANGGYDVVGVDINQQYVDALNNGVAPVIEPRLQDFITASRDRLRATLDVEEAVLASDVTFIIVPTPSGDDDRFINDYLIEALKALGAALRQKRSYHMAVITSTVMPGSMNGVLRQALESASGRCLGDSLGLCYSPEFIALGNVINDMLRPDFVLIGESDAHAGDLLSTIYQTVCEYPPEFRRMNFVNAEICKIAINTFVTTKISYANMLSEVCDNLAGADVDIVSNAVGSDSRIGTKYLKGGMAYGGPCFPRDNRAFAALARDLDTACHIATATDDVNRHQISRVIRAVAAHTADGGAVTILGLSYKPDTDVIEQSPGILLIEGLRSLGFKITAHDPLALANARKSLDETVVLQENLKQAVDGAETIVIATPWPQYADLSPTLENAGVKTVIDPWRIFDAQAFESVRLISLGRASSTGAAGLRPPPCHEPGGKGASNTVATLATVDYFKQWLDADIPSVSLLDVGVSGGIDARWRAFGDRLSGLGVDPRVQEIERLTALESNANFHYMAAYVTWEKWPEAMPSPSEHHWHTGSLYRSSARRAREIAGPLAGCSGHQQAANNGQVENKLAEKEVEIDGLLAVMPEKRIDFIKTDTDGHDLPALMGGRTILSSHQVLGLAVECNFNGLSHPHANNFANIDQYLRSLGFTLFDLQPHRYSRAALPDRFAHPIFAQTKSGTVQWADALYFRDFCNPEFTRKTGWSPSRDDVIRQAMLLEAFGQIDSAVELLLRFRELHEFDDLSPLFDELVGRHRGSDLGTDYADLIANFEKSSPVFFPDTAPRKVQA